VTLSASVVIVSHGRPDALSLCLTGVGQLDYPNFEIVVVADSTGVSAVKAHPHSAQIKLVPFETPNISAARNAGIAASGGEIVAFIDDDAVPEPTWLTYLIGPFSDGQIAAAGGYVIGRNGISFQWKGRTVDVEAQTEDLPLPADDPLVFGGTPVRAIKTEGTNMAVRRNVLAALGGFDPAFHFYLDETDLNMRLGQAEHRTAIVPLAQVHHGFAESERRFANRVPRDLRQIGASLAVYLRKHDGDLGRRVPERAVQLERLKKHQAAGRLTAADVAGLMNGFDAGWADGLSRSFGAKTVFPLSDFAAFVGQMTADRRVITGRFWQRRRKMAFAKAAVNNGQHVTVILLSLTARRHRVAFTKDGVWLQTGGQFGQSNRSEPRIQFWRASSRFQYEKMRVLQVRYASPCG
jgi:O-antigen biosynthesis protein